MTTSRQRRAADSRPSITSAWRAGRATSSRRTPLGPSTRSRRNLLPCSSRDRTTGRTLRLESRRDENRRHDRDRPGDRRGVANEPRAHRGRPASLVRGRLAPACDGAEAQVMILGSRYPRTSQRAPGPRFTWETDSTQDTHSGNRPERFQPFLEICAAHGQSSRTTIVVQKQGLRAEHSAAVLLIEQRWKPDGPWRARVPYGGARILRCRTTTTNVSLSRYRCA